VPELYDLDADPGELHNLAPSFPDVVAELTAESDAHLARGGALPAEELPVDEETIERLERLGYVGGGGGDRSELERDLWNPSGRDPKEMVDFFNRLQELPTIMMSGRYDEAEGLLQDLRAQDPDNTNVLTKLALLRRMEENWEDAAHWCRELLRRDPADNDTRMNLAFALTKLGRHDEAKAAYREVIARDPRSGKAWGLLASLHAQDNEAEEARVAFERALALDPDDAGVLAAYGSALEDEGDPARALALFDRALAVDPAHAAAVNGKALALSHTGRPREAVEVLRGGLPALQDDVDTLNNLAWILTNERIDPAEGLELARRARALAPEDAAVLDTFGWSAIRAGKPAEAIAALQDAWQRTSDAEVRAHLGVALAESGNEAEGIAHVKEAIRERPALADVPEVARWDRP
jgi:Tfp pilus assembly protein PilF